MTVYYNEIDPFAAEWIRQLIQQQHIPFGTVDERDIRDVTPSDLRPFRQCHFFAGIAVWAYAGTRAGYDPDRRWWSGSCPCQPFSASGKRNGFDDERHLWPSWCYLIGECRPSEIVGEQVASKDGYAWLDLVQADMEGMGYACGAVVSPSAGYGAPHERHRTYFGAKSLEHSASNRRFERRSESSGWSVASRCSTKLVADTHSEGPQRRSGMLERPDQFIVGAGGMVGSMADTAKLGPHGRRSGETGNEPGTIERFDGFRSIGAMAHAHKLDDDGTRFGTSHDVGKREQASELSEREPDFRTGPVNGFWRDADWLKCRDERWRAVEPGTFPLANGAAARVGRLRGYGNAINAEQAVAFLEAFNDA